MHKNVLNQFIVFCQIKKAACDLLFHADIMWTVMFDIS